MIYREATTADIDAYMIVRMSVKENVLNNPALVTYEDNVEYLNVRGKGWVCETENTIVGFAIADLKDHNIWALFVQPEYEGKGIGKQLHNLMLDWYFTHTKETVWLGTAPNTRAEKFYTKSGWTNVGVVNKGEVKFEMSYDEWQLWKERQI